MGNEKLPMRIAVGQMRELTDENINFIRQLGIKDVQFNFYHGSPHLSGDSSWDYMDLLRLRTRCEDAGFRLNAIENTPINFYDKAMLGLPGRDEQIENMQKTIRNMGRAGIPIFGYHFIVTGVWRTSSTAPARGGAKVTAFDYEAVKDAPLSFDRVYSEDEIWKNYEYISKHSCPRPRRRVSSWRCTPTTHPCPHWAALPASCAASTPSSAPWRSATAPIISSISALAPGQR